MSFTKLRIKTNDFCYFLSTCLFSTQTSSKNPIRNTKVMYKDLFFSREVKSFFCETGSKSTTTYNFHSKVCFLPALLYFFEKKLGSLVVGSLGTSFVIPSRLFREASGDQEAAMINECCIIRFHIMFEVNFSLNHPC